MQIVNIITDSWGYAGEALKGHYQRWIILIVCTIIFPLGLGYVVRILEGKIPAPEPDQYKTLFIDGIRLIVVALGYLLIEIALWGAMYGILTIYGNSHSTNPLEMAGVLLVIGIPVLLSSIIVSLVACMGLVRFARTGSMKEAYNIRAISRILHNLGWFSFFIATVVMHILFKLIQIPLLIITIIAAVLFPYPFTYEVIFYALLLIVMPFLMILAGRFLSLSYDEGELSLES